MRAARHRGPTRLPRFHLDAEGKSEHYYYRETGALLKRANRVSQILENRFRKWQAATVSIFFFDPRHAAEFAQRCLTRFLRAHPLSHILLDLHFEMRADLLLLVSLQPSLQNIPRRR
jgi:hypothetical protein